MLYIITPNPQQIGQNRCLIQVNDLEVAWTRKRMSWLNTSSFPLRHLYSFPGAALTETTNQMA